MEQIVKSRRDFFSRHAPAAFLGAIGVWAGSLLRFTMPSLLPQETRRIKLGMASDYPAGTVKIFEEDRVIVFSDEAGMYAVSTTCTHLGCVVSWSGRGFLCPCHGSKFGTTGEVEAGPAPRGLNWHRIVKLSSGQLAVELGRTVKPGTKESFHV